MKVNLVEDTENSKIVELNIQAELQSYERVLVNRIRLP